MATFAHCSCVSLRANSHTRSSSLVVTAIRRWETRCERDNNTKMLYFNVSHLLFPLSLSVLKVKRKIEPSRFSFPWEISDSASFAVNNLSLHAADEEFSNYIATNKLWKADSGVRERVRLFSCDPCRKPKAHADNRPQAREIVVMCIKQSPH